MQSAATDYPRPEYPRPERQRGTIEGWDWLNLNGPWQFRFDGDRRGVEEQWFLSHDCGANEWSEQIIVPFCWESLAAWGEGATAGNDNYYATRVFRNPLEVNPSNHRTAARYEVGWYRRTIEVPDNPTWQGKRVILTVGAADFFSDCWCNGVHVGHHEDGYTPFEFDLTDHLQTAPDGRRTAVIVLRVEDPMDNREQPVGKQWTWYTTTSGIWQTVFLEPRAAAFIDAFRIVSDIDAATATFKVECIGADEAGWNVVARITPPEGAASEHVMPVEEGMAEATIPVDPLLLWGPNHPHLYRVTLSLQRQGVGPDVPFDQLQTYFGMRKIDSIPSCEAEAPAALRLNGKPRYLRGALYQSFFPDGVYTASSAQVLKDDIAFAQKAGFNLLRVHIKIDDPLLLYYADTMGMMLMADFPNFGEGGDTDLGRGRFEAMMRAGMRRDWNHPSIVAWCLFNETWGFGGQVELVKLFPALSPVRGANIANVVHGAAPVTSAVNALAVESRAAETPVAPMADAPAGEAEAAPPVPQATEATPESVAAAQVLAERRKVDNSSAHKWVRDIWHLAKDLDDTRLIEDMSVVFWEHLDYYGHVETDINSWHFYTNDYEHARRHINDVASSTFPGSKFNYAEGWQQGTQPLINSEYGGVGALDDNRDTSWSFKFLTNELRRHGQIAAYIYTELHDVEWEYNGFMSYDRSAKEFGYNPAIINAADVLPIDAPPIASHAPGQTVRIDVSSSHYSTRQRENVMLRWRLSGIDTLGVEHQDIVRGSVPIPFKHRVVEHAHTIEFQTPDATMLCTLSVEAIASDGDGIASNFVHLFVSPGYPFNRDEHPRRLILRGAPGDWDKAEWSRGQGSREEARHHDCCFGFGHGFYEWALPLLGANIGDAKRLRILCESSSRRVDTPQTSRNTYPTTMQMSLNGVPVYDAVVPDHPHDARGALSYLRGERGAHGFLARAIAEGEDLHQIAARSGDGYLRLRCAVPPSAFLQGGLTVYGSECGRYPISPTVIVEW